MWETPIVSYNTNGSNVYARGTDGHDAAVTAWRTPRHAALRRSGGTVSYRIYSEAVRTIGYVIG